MRAFVALIFYYVFVAHSPSCPPFNLGLDPPLQQATAAYIYIAFGIYIKQEIRTQVIEQETARTFNFRDIFLSTQRKAFTIRV